MQPDRARTMTGLRPGEYTSPELRRSIIAQIRNMKPNYDEMEFIREHKIDPGSLKICEDLFLEGAKTLLRAVDGPERDRKTLEIMLRVLDRPSMRASEKRELFRVAVYAIADEIHVPLAKPPTETITK